MRWKIIEKETIDEIIFRTTKVRNRLILELMARGGMRIGDLIPARYLLERAASHEGPWQPKSMLLLAKTFQGLGNIDMYRTMLEQVIERYSGTLFATEARNILNE